MTRVIWISVVGVVLYSGPLLPLLVTLLLTKTAPERFRRNVRLTVILTAVQASAFLPYVLALANDWPDADYALYLPAGTGVLLFVGALVYAISQYTRVRAVDRRSG